jgi:possible thiamine pyrophosphate enzyme
MEKGLNSEHSIIDILKNINCDTVFVIPGSLTNILYELDTNNIRIINAFHEEQLGFMAIGYYLQTGKIPVIIVSQGPGETNLVTSIASAYREQIPILILSAFQNDESQVYFQQTSGNYHTPNICGIMKNITEAYFLVEKKLGNEDFSKIIGTINHCKYPIYIGINENFNSKKGIIKYEINIKNQENNFYKAIDILNKYKSRNNVVVLIGAGAKGICKEIVQLAMQYKYKIVTTLKSINLVKTYSKDYLGHIGIMGHDEANLFLSEHCEVIFSFGSSLSGNSLAKWFDNFLQRNGLLININAEDTLKYKNRVFIQTNLPNSPNNCYVESSSHNKITMNKLFNVLHAKTESRTYILESYKKKFISSLILNESEELMMVGGFGPLGSSISIGIGASLANSNIHYIVLCGDGGFLFSGMTILNIVKYKLPILILINVNGEYKTVADGQRKKINKTIATDLQLPNIEYTQNYFGIKHTYISKVEEFEVVYDTFLQNHEPIIVFAPDTIYE